MFRIDGNILIETHAYLTINRRFLETSGAAGRPDSAGVHRHHQRVQVATWLSRMLEVGDLEACQTDIRAAHPGRIMTG